MREYTIVGFKTFKSKKTGKEYTCLFTEFDDDTVVGTGCEQFLAESVRVHGELKLGAQVYASYQRNSSYIDSIQIV